MTSSGDDLPSRLDLYWIPLGAGERVVRISGWIYERCVAAVQRRAPTSLFHSALVAHTASDDYCIEMTPVPRHDTSDQRGVVGEGAVGFRVLGRFRMFRYELRRWKGGTIPDLRFAMASPVLVSSDPRVVAGVLDLLAGVPKPVWGRDEMEAGEMWNSNSVISWVLSRAGVVEAAGSPPGNGRAPGWDAGVAVARRGLG